jgi:hypothetical protein
MKTKVFKVTTPDLEVFQAIANVDVGGKITVHYLPAFSYKETPFEIINILSKMVEKWAEKNGYQMWAY